MAQPQETPRVSAHGLIELSRGSFVGRELLLRRSKYGLSRKT